MKKTFRLSLWKYYGIFLFGILSVCSPTSLTAQNLNGAQQAGTKITGVVTDEKGEPITGATVMVVNTTNGVITDYDGNFSILVKTSNASLKISYVGFEDQTIALGSKKVLKVVMHETTTALNEVQIVAYGTQKKVTVTGAISSVSGSDLVKSPSGSMSNALAGKVTGVTTVQYSGEPGADAAEIYVRGITTLNNSSPLIQVDGVERDFTQIDPNEVESITVLKDASATAVFGVRGANGVILVTTKRGKEGKAKISASTSFGVQVPTNLIKMANSYQYATYYNEASANDGITPDKFKFQPNVVDAFKNHTNPLLYPDINWMDYLLKPAATQSQQNINITGGTDRIRYFVSMGLFSQTGLFKTFDAGYDFNFDYKRYNYRANIDFDITKKTVLSVNLGGRVEDKNTPIGRDADDQLFRFLYRATPFGGAGIVDDKWIKTNPDYINNPGDDGLSAYYGRGYTNKVTNVLNLDIALKQNLDMITKGLSFEVKGSYNSSYDHYKSRTSSIPYYTPVITNANGDIALRKSGDDNLLGYSESFGKGRNWYAQTSINYNRKFGDHSIGALLLYNQSKTYYPKTYADIPTGYVGYVGRVTYDWKSRYMADFNVGYNGSENFAPDRRYGLFPAASVGWILTEEPFMKNQKIVDYFKFRASYGLVGNDKIGDNRFLYLPDSYLLNQGGYNFGTNNPSSPIGASEGSLSNPFVTWEKAYKQNYGVDVNFLRNRLKLNVDYFTEKRIDILVSTATTVPAFFGVPSDKLPQSNRGKVNSHGYEITVRWEDKAGESFSYYVSPNLSFSRNKIIYMAEVRPNEPYMAQTGNPVGQPIMLHFWGFYDANANARYKAEFGEDIPKHSVTLKPGDCVYVDMNRDGKIDANDAAPAGYTNNPEYIAGLNAGCKYKKFDFSMQWSGAWNASRSLSETLRAPLGETYTDALLLSQFNDRWTPETASSAKQPRPSFAAYSNNYAYSDLSLVNASYVRLKNIELGYTFDFAFMAKIKMSSLRLYANGYNLLTFSGLKVTDPESRTTDRPSYPVTKVFNLGLKIEF